jgi:hypothetical protein
VNAVHQLAMAAGMQGTDAKRIEDLVRACPHAAEAIAAASTTEGMMAAAQTSGEDAWAPRRGARGRDRARAVGVTVRRCDLCDSPQSVASCVTCWGRGQRSKATWPGRRSLNSPARRPADAPRKCARNWLL